MLYSWLYYYSTSKQKKQGFLYTFLYFFKKISRKNRKINRKKKKKASEKKQKNKKHKHISEQKANSGIVLNEKNRGGRDPRHILQ